MGNVAPRPVPHTVGKNESAFGSTCERSTKHAFGEFAEIAALLKLDFLEDMDAYAKFVDSVGKVVDSSSFAKHTTHSRRSYLLALMQKTTILAAKSMRIN